MAGSDLLVKPVVTEGSTVASVYFPGTSSLSLWYDAETLQAVVAKGRGAGEYRDIEAPIDKIPVFQRGGSIIPR
ncbi:unnamed protein product [Hapterophycus canaliculatus]